MTTESEDEVNFYSEGLSNHATSYVPGISGHESASNTNNLVTIANSLPANGSILAHSECNPCSGAHPRRVVHQTSNSTVCEGDTGGQKESDTVRMRGATAPYINSGARREASGSMKANRLNLNTS